MELTSRDDLIGKVVSAETDEFLRVLFPVFQIETEFDPFRSEPSIYKGRMTSKNMMKLRNRGPRFVAWVKEGGEIALTREALFGLINRRKRKYPEALEKMEPQEFTNLMKLLDLTGTLSLEEEDSSVYDLFIEVSKNSKTSIALALRISETTGPMRVLYSLITFYSRIISEGDSSATSAHYTNVIRRCQKRKPLFKQALKTLPLFQGSTPDALILYLLLQVL